ncbi:MAG: hypothetical protein HC883_02905 [Bdellovibrionaceae bacterium]|nr:hypothetical protein [Pseudobdellovibrionaceae bacterium]
MMILFILALAITGTAQAKPKFHCYTYPNAAVAAYQTPVKCADGEQMEVVCTYSAGCMPAPAPGEPPEKSLIELNVMFTSSELKGSFLICKGKGEVKDGRLVAAQCPTATQCQEDGFFDGISASVSPTVSPTVSRPVSAPVNPNQKGQPGVQR